MSVLIGAINISAAASAFLAAWYWQKSATGGAPVITKRSTLQTWFGSATRWNRQAAYFAGASALLNLAAVGIALSVLS